MNCMSGEIIDVGDRIDLCCSPTSPSPRYLTTSLGNGCTVHSNSLDLQESKRGIYGIVSRRVGI